MKVLLLADPSSVHTIKWANSLNEKGINLSVFGFSSYQKSAYNNEISTTSLNIKPHKIVRSNIYLHKSIYLISIFHLRRILKLFNPDIIHAHYASSYGFLGRIINFRPYFISVWGSDVFEFPKRSSITKRVFKYSLNGADKIFSTSRIMAKELSKYTSKKIEVIPFGIDLNIFKRLSNYGKSEETFVIGTVKALEEIYGIEYLIKAFKIIKDKYSRINVRLLIVGSGSQEMKLKELCKELHIEKNVEFTGKVSFEKLTAYYNRMDVAVFLSKSESFGVAVLEASACEVPVIVSNVGGLPEVVENNITGFIVEKENPVAASEAIEKLMLEPDLRNQMGTNGRKRVEKFYNWNDCVDQMINIYSDILNG